MNETEIILSLVKKLDWRAEPKPSPYQERAWAELQTFPKQEVKDALEKFAQELRFNCPEFFPFNYSRLINI
jgi:hypothetical protein